MLISLEKVVMKEVKKLMGLGKNYEVLKVDEVNEERQIVKYIYILLPPPVKNKRHT